MPIVTTIVASLLLLPLLPPLLPPLLLPSQVLQMKAAIETMEADMKRSQDEDDAHRSREMQDLLAIDEKDAAMQEVEDQIRDLQQAQGWRHVHMRQEGFLQWQWVVAVRMLFAHAGRDRDAVELILCECTANLAWHVPPLWPLPARLCRFGVWQLADLNCSDSEVSSHSSSSEDSSSSEVYRPMPRFREASRHRLCY